MKVNLVEDQLTEHFGLSEFVCSDGDSAMLTPRVLIFIRDVLEPFRVWYNRPININSGYRTKEHNAKVGGSSNSLHLIGQAIDFNLPSDYIGMAKGRQQEFLRNVHEKWTQLCKAVGAYPHMGIYNGYLHLGISWDYAYYKDYR